MSRGWWMLLSLTALPAVAAEYYRLDGGNTRVSFSVHVFGVPWLSAQFADLSGELVSERRSDASRVDMVVETQSIACESAWWRARLLSPEWFDAKRYPQITYHSSRVHSNERGGALIDGELSLHGHSRAVPLSVERWSCTAGASSDEDCSFEAHAHIRRSDYGLPHGFWLGGDEVEISIRGAGVRPEISH